MECCLRSLEAAANESLCHVDGGKLCINIPYYDGGNDVLQTCASFNEF